MPINLHILDQRMNRGRFEVLVLDSKTKKEAWKPVDQYLGRPVLGPP